MRPHNKASRLSHAFVALMLAPTMAGAAGLEGHVGLETRGFFEKPLWPGQARDNWAVFGELESDGENGDFSYGLRLFGRWDNQDPRRSRLDIREAHVQWARGVWSGRIGVDRVFWGVTESRHLVDVVNQTDLVADINEETKLGQPMLKLTRQWQDSSLDVFVLPYFRERSLPGPAGRLRPGVVVAQEQAIYESNARQRHVDLAARYAFNIERWDVGLTAFRGTQREPSLLPATGPGGDVYLRPYYGQISQVGLDLQYTVGAWLWKTELLHRDNEFDASGVRGAYTAAVAGFEYTFFNAAENVDVGVLLEGLYDSRGTLATTPLQRDVFVGSRLVINDASNTDVIVGVIVDTQKRDTLWRIEANRRLNDNWSVQLKGIAFGNQAQGAPLHDVRDDSYVSLSLTHWF